MTCESITSCSWAEAICLSAYSSAPVVFYRVNVRGSSRSFASITLTATISTMSSLAPRSEPAFLMILSVCLCSSLKCCSSSTQHKRLSQHHRLIEGSQKTALHIKEPYPSQDIEFWIWNFCIACSGSRLIPTDSQIPHPHLS